jgi:3'-5' exonuclease
MLDNIKLEKILFLDTETVPLYSVYQEMTNEYKEFWDKKSSQFRKEGQSAEEVYGRAGIYAEFGKVICISFGIFHNGNFRIKSFFGDDEKNILTNFASLLTKMNTSNDLALSAHNGKEFDFPYISRRMLINGIRLPSVLDVAGRKPWETAFLDTMELWKFGDYKNYTSLNLLSYLLGIPSSKTDIDGSKVAEVYWKDKDISRIVRYCQNDVIALVRLFLKLKGNDMLTDEKIEIVE